MGSLEVLCWVSGQITQKMATSVSIIITCFLALPIGAFDDYKINLFENADRTLDLSDIGVNLTQTFNSLLSPEGIVNQFSLSIVIQIIFVVGYVVSGLLLAAL